MKAEDKSRHIMMPLLLISLGLYYLIIIEGCFTGDDMYNSCIRGYLSERGISVWAYMREQAMAWFKDGGRIFPLAVLQYLVFYIFPSVKAYKLFLVIYTLLCVYIMGKVVFEITKEPFWEKASIFLGGLLMPLFSYGAVNPMTNFGGLVQSVIFFGLLAILLELKGLQTRKGWMIWGSAVLSGCAMLTYEIGFAIPINSATDVISQLKDHQKVLRPYIGITGINLDEQTAKKYKLEVGVYIKSVEDFSPAEKSGLKSGDVIIKADGKSITTMDELNEIKNSHQIGDTITLTVNRNGNNKDITVTLEETP